MSLNEYFLIADRDISSFYAHAQTRLFESPPSIKKLLAELIRYVWSQNPVVPDLLVYIQTPREVCLQRSIQRSHKPMPYIFEASYFERLSEGYQHMIEARGEGYSLIIDGLAHQDEHIIQIKQAIRQIKTLPLLNPITLINHLIGNFKNEDRTLKNESSIKGGPL